MRPDRIERKNKVTDKKCSTLEGLDLTSDGEKSSGLVDSEQ